MWRAWADSSRRRCWKAAAPWSLLLEDRITHDSVDTWVRDEASQPCRTPFIHTSTDSGRSLCLRDTGSTMRSQLCVTPPCWIKNNTHTHVERQYIFSFAFSLACVFCISHHLFCVWIMFRLILIIVICFYWPRTLLYSPWTKFYLHLHVYCSLFHPDKYWQITKVKFQGDEQFEIDDCFGSI